MAWIGCSIPVVGMAVIDNKKEDSRLAKIADVSYNGSALHLYGFDEDGNGSIDRIDKIGLSGYKSMVFPVHQTFRDGESGWDSEHKKLLALGTRRE